MKLRALLGPVVLGALLTACGHGGGRMRASTPASEPHVTIISMAVQQPDVRAAIGRALAAQKFSTEKDDDGSIVANYQKGARSLKLAIDYNPQKITFRYLDSQGMGANVDASGQVLLDRHYSDLISKLDGAIKDELARPGREAQAQAQAQSDAAAAAERQARQDQIDAEERQRAYQLALEHEKTRQAHANERAAEARAMMPPAIRVETQTAQPGPDYYWTPGHWGWESGRYQWTAGFWAQQYANQAPPPPQTEDPGIPPSENYFWVRGHHRWSGNGYVWVSGHWDTVRAGFTFVPPHWENMNGRWMHVEGRWVSRN